jgi:homoaconitase/3-isopropylmalate dehydratase large subunit
MNPSPTTPLTTKMADKDLIEQAHPDHGVPSQDPASAAQFPLVPEEAEREGNSVLVGGGLMAGMATGAAIGAAVAGPVGVVVGGSAGAVVGALGAAAAGTMVHPEDTINADTAPATSKPTDRA